jgi:L-threonylcarbamoyladenylate synthase
MKIGNDIALAAQLLRQGNLVAIPTETVYGLAANGLNPDAVVKIFEAKNRPFFDPLILHTDSLEKIRQWVKEVPEQALLLAEKFWPGPLTLLLPKKEIIPDIVTSGLTYVAVRIPNHPLTLRLLQQLDFPLAAPSANPFGYVSPTTADHVFRQLGHRVDYILDGGACSVGIESTIIGWENEEVVVYRYGGLPLEVIQSIHKNVRTAVSNSSNPRAPGQLKSHYAPLKPLYVGNLEKLLAEHGDKKLGIISFYKNVDGVKTIPLSLAMDLKEAAFQLFAAIRKLDEDEDVEIILAEIFPDEFFGRAINDRLQRASFR